MQLNEHENNQRLLLKYFQAQPQRKLLTGAKGLHSRAASSVLRDDGDTSLKQSGSSLRSTLGNTQSAPQHAEGQNDSFPYSNLNDRTL